MGPLDDASSGRFMVKTHRADVLGRSGLTPMQSVVQVKGSSPQGGDHQFLQDDAAILLMDEVKDLAVETDHMGPVLGFVFLN